MVASFTLPVPIPPDSSLSEKEREHIERELSLNWEKAIVNAKIDFT